jgi:hypothetical protein
MTISPSKPSCDQVLESFAMEPDNSGQTLKRYLQDYPEYATQLVDLSLEIFRFSIVDESSLSEEDQMRIDSAWNIIQSTRSEIASDPIAELSVPKLRKIAQSLKVPRQVITAFRERTVIVSSVPMRFLTQFAGMLGINIQEFLNALALPPQSLARNYKADGKPTQAGQVTFEQLLRDAGMSDEQIELLLSENDPDGRN